ncbi:hypothetical protein F0562_003714 [Nyssa sinensis]|uniref:Reverse transcriptase zinc-binding domain-containing protein n=1 Tax=Nyssa sinensis TaxID=561372 RepID=A0A5J5C0J4_9ASTE|nr:hypothetical protein F0562_003714 [Nyssa sinensis]
MEKIKEKLPGGQKTQQPHCATTTGGEKTQQPHGATTTLGGGHGCEEITNTISPNMLPSRDKEDLIKWLPNPAGTFSTKFTWEEVRARYSQVPWKDIIKYSFILWLLFRNRLMTKDELKWWGLNIDEGTCVLCQNQSESSEHLFFQCPFSAHIWKKVLQNCGIHRFPANWSMEKNFAISECKGSNFSASVRLFAPAASVYHI